MGRCGHGERSPGLGRRHRSVEGDAGRRVVSVGTVGDHCVPVGTEEQAAGPGLHCWRWTPPPPAPRPGDQRPQVGGRVEPTVASGPGNGEPGAGDRIRQFVGQLARRGPGRGVVGRRRLRQSPEGTGAGPGGEAAEQPAEGGHVGGRIELVVLAHPTGRAEPAQHRAPVGAQEDVFGEDRPVDDPQLVQVGQGGGDGPDHTRDLLDRQRHRRGQRRPADEDRHQDRSLGAALETNQLHHAGVSCRRQQVGLGPDPLTPSRGF